MLRRYVIIINVLLIVVSFFLLSKIFRVWAPLESPKPAAIKKENTANLPALKVSFAPHNPRNAYQGIVDKDLFRPERTEWKSPTEEGKNVSARIPPQIVVYGIVITKASKFAWIQEQGKTAKMIKISEGGEISGWRVVTIESNTLSIKNGDQILTFNLIQPGKPKTRSIPKQTLRSPPKKSTKPSADTQSGPAPAFAPQPSPVPPPPPLPEKK
jgi:hypothetical protein